MFSPLATHDSQLPRSGRRSRLLITGGAGFIGSNLVRHLLAEGHEILNLDKLTYAGNLDSLRDIADQSAYHFAQVDICDAEAIRQAITEFRPDAVMHLAAESHVDRSIDGPRAFIETNVIGTLNMLEVSLEYWRELSGDAHDSFRFLHVSTDEVYGSLGPDGKFTEETGYDPHSPYSASKASSDHLARAWHDTYGLPVIVTNCSNNYGPYQFPEKLIPVVILKCLRGEPIPVYGKGENIRDWLYVEDHCRALQAVLQRGTPGETYNIGGNNELRNIDLVKMLCEIMDELRPRSGEWRVARGEENNSSSVAPATFAAGRKPSGSERTPYLSPLATDDSGAPAPLATRYSQLVTFVQDRPGHDLRYAIDASKIERELGWQPQEDFQSGFRKTVQWYLDNEQWWQNILSGDYKLERQGRSEWRVASGENITAT